MKPAFVGAANRDGEVLGLEEEGDNKDKRWSFSAVAEGKNVGTQNGCSIWVSVPRSVFLGPERHKDDGFVTLIMDNT